MPVALKKRFELACKRPPYEHEINILALKLKSGKWVVMRYKGSVLQGDTEFVLNRDLMPLLEKIMKTI